jgi:DNA-binding NtrC family response regulator
MQPVLQIIERVGASDANVLITGENGTGKGVVAQTLHVMSNRASRPMVTANVGGLPEGVFESEMFGHVKGAFTDAKADRVGRFEMAEGGTLFLDEIANLPIKHQPKLLRVLETGEFERVGSSKTRRSDVRIISATNADLNEEVSAGRFRQDLLFRLNTVEIHLPPLRDRREDIPLLVHHFLNKFALQHGEPARRFANESMRVLMTHDWPGNVRELENAVEHALTMGAGEVLLPEDLPASVTAPERDIVAEATLDDASLAEVERRYIIRVLEKMGGHQIKTSRILGIDRRTLYRRLRQYGYAGRLRNEDEEEFDESDTSDNVQASASSI